MKEYPFPWPDESKGYKIFPDDMEQAPLVLFHGTFEKNLSPIINDGFKSSKRLDPDSKGTGLESVSYATESSQALGHACGRRDPNRPESCVVFAVRFQSLKIDGIIKDGPVVHVYKSEIQPEIIGYCIVPHGYKHI